MERLVDFDPNGIRPYEELKAIVGTGPAGAILAGIAIEQINNRMEGGSLDPIEGARGILRIATRTGLLEQ